ncbi:DUF262 domain-containing protein [Pseudomonas aeruginosa]
MNKPTDKITLAENASYEDEDFQDIPPVDIVAYNELRSCADLYRMYEDDTLDIKPDYQRDIAWKGPAQTRFIDSLIKQLPIPSLCFSYDYKKEKWQVIDGLQRISSIIRFLDPTSDWIMAGLEDVDPRIANKKVTEFQRRGSDLNKLKRRVENATLPITILRCDPSLESHANYLFTIFHRLNTGGTKLNNQEIRNCIFSGNFNNLLKELDQNKKWLKINRKKIYTNDRFKRQELILRFFAFSEKFEDYKEGLAKFLNNYMRSNRSISVTEIDEKRQIFTRVIEALAAKLGKELARERLNLSLLEALLVGVARNIQTVEGLTQEQAAQRFKNLKENDEFTEEKLVGGLSKTARVMGRLKAAVQIFG